MWDWIFRILFLGIPAIAVIVFIVSLILMIVMKKKDGNWKLWMVLMIVSAPVVLLTIAVLIFIALANMGAIRFM